MKVTELTAWPTRPTEKPAGYTYTVRAARQIGKIRGPCLLQGHIIIFVRVSPMGAVLDITTTTQSAPLPNSSARAHWSKTDQTIFC